MVYADSASTTLICQSALDAQRDFYAKTQGVGGARGSGDVADTGRHLVAAATKTITDFFHVRRAELIFTSGATAALNLFAQTWGRTNLRHGDKIILSVLNHHSNISPWHFLATELNLQLEFLPIHHGSGALDISSLESLLLEPATRLLSLTHMSNVTGNFIPLDKITALLKKANKIRASRQQLPVRILIDGAQGALWRPLDFANFHLDFYIFTGHKMAAATGIGGLLARQEHLLSGELLPFFVGGGAVEQVTLGSTHLVSNLERRFSAGTPHSVGIISLAAALSYLSTFDLEKEYERVSLLTKELLNYFSGGCCDTNKIVRNYAPEKGLLGYPSGGCCDFIPEAPASSIKSAERFQANSLKRVSPTEGVTSIPSRKDPVTDESSRTRDKNDALEADAKKQNRVDKEINSEEKLLATDVFCEGERSLISEPRAKDMRRSIFSVAQPLTPLFPAQPPSPILALTSSRYNVRDIANFLALRSISTRVGHHCTQPLHRSLGVEDSLRFSFSLHNTPEDILAIISALQDLTNHLGL